MKHYFIFIALLQNILLGMGVLILMVLPLLILYTPDSIFTYTTFIYAIAHASVFFVMLIRPLADIFRGVRIIRPLVILRKGSGVLSASLVVSFMIAKLLADPQGYFDAFTHLAYWSFEKYALLAHLADITALLLLVTSNAFSKRVLGRWWKRVQKLSYVFFYASGLYVFLSFETKSVLYYMIIITIVTLIAYLRNRSIQKRTLNM